MCTHGSVSCDDRGHAREVGDLAGRAPGVVRELAALAVGADHREVPDRGQLAPELHVRAAADAAAVRRDHERDRRRVPGPVRARAARRRRSGARRRERGRRPSRPAPSRRRTELTAPAEPSRRRRPATQSAAARSGVRSSTPAASRPDSTRSARRNRVDSAPAGELDRAGARSNAVRPADEPDAIRCPAGRRRRSWSVAGRLRPGSRRARATSWADAVSEYESGPNAVGTPLTAIRRPAAARRAASRRPSRSPVARLLNEHQPQRLEERVVGDAVRREVHRAVAETVERGDARGLAGDERVRRHRRGELAVEAEHELVGVVLAARKRARLTP